MSEEDRLARRRDKFFVAFGRIGIRWPATVSVLLALLTVAGIFFSTKLTITTSRFGLVDADNWYQRRMIDFFEKFGYPDSPVAIVEGGTPEQRRETVDQLVAALEQDELFAGRTLAKVDVEQIAETLLTQQPGSIAALRQQLPPDADLPAAIEGGLPGMFGLLEGQLLAVLDGELAVDASNADKQLERLATFARALDRKLAADAGQGEPPDSNEMLAGLAAEGQDSMLPTVEELRSRGLDEQGYFVSNDGERLLVAIFPEFAGDEVADYAPAVERLRELRDQLAARPGAEGVSITFTGLPFLVVDEEAALASGLFYSSVATGLGIFLLVLWAFRSIKRAAVALLPIGVGTIVSLGALYLLFETLDPITSSFAAVLMGLGIDFSIHLLARYDEDLRRGATRRHALFSSLAKAGPGVVTGAVTTALSFLTIATTEFTSYGEMGIITAIGLIVALLCALLLLPVLVGRGNLDKTEQPRRPMPELHFLPAWVRAAPLPIVLIAVTLALVGTTVIPSYNPRYLELLPPSWESTQALRTLEKDGAMTPWFAWVTAEDLEQARSRAESLRGMESVARVDSPTDLLPELDEPRLAALRADFAGLERDPDWAKLAARTPTAEELSKRVLAIEDALDELVYASEQAGRDAKPITAAKQAFGDLRKRLESTPTAAATLDALENQIADVLGRAWTTARTVATRGHWVPEDLPEMFELRFVARDGSGRVALFVYPAGNVTSGVDGNAAARRFTEDLESVDPEAAGQGISLYRHNAWILHGFKRASAFSLVLVLILLMLDFADLRKALFALFPVLVGMGWMVGIFAMLDLRLNVATIVVMPLILGVGIDAGVHMMHRLEINSRAHGGRGRIDEIIHGTGGAVIFSSLTTIVGFAGLLLGQHLGMVHLGAAMVIGIGCTLIASVVVLPALLILFNRAD